MASVTTEDGWWGCRVEPWLNGPGRSRQPIPRASPRPNYCSTSCADWFGPTASDSAWTKALSLRTPESVEERLHELRLAAAVANPDRRVAYHEAGQAVMARMLGVPFAGVSIDEGKVDRISFSRKPKQL